jgi:uncharacterized protein
VAVGQTAISRASAAVRTCVGCRQKASATELLRVTAGSIGTGDRVPIRVDVRRRASGRGAWIHPSLECVTVAERRKAFGRALRLGVPVDLAEVKQYVESATS